MEVRYQVISGASLCSKRGLFWGQARWLRGLSNRVFKTAEDRERNLLRPTTWWKKALLYTRLLFQLHYLLVSQKAWVHLLINLHVGTGMLLLAALFSKLNKPQSHSLSSQKKCSSPSTHWCHLLSSPICLCLHVTGEPKDEVWVE